jgi:hypothetical protein
MLRVPCTALYAGAPGEPPFGVVILDTISEKVPSPEITRVYELAMVEPFESVIVELCPHVPVSNARVGDCGRLEPVKVAVIVALPVKVTVVEADVALAKDALPVGVADHPENTNPELGVAMIAVATPALTVVTDTGVMVPLVNVPGVNV